MAASLAERLGKIRRYYYQGIHFPVIHKGYPFMVRSHIPGIKIRRTVHKGKHILHSRRWILHNDSYRYILYIQRHTITYQKNHHNRNDYPDDETALIPHNLFIFLFNQCGESSQEIIHFPSPPSSGCPLQWQ